MRRHILPAVVLGLATAAPAAALDMPARRPGLWEIRTISTSRDNQSGLMQQCVDPATDQLMSSMGETVRAMCSKQEVTHVGATYVMDSVCQFGPMTSTTHGVLTGDFNSAYTVTTTSTREGGPKGRETSTSTVSARWVGPCTADLIPGDMIMPNGMKINVLEMQRNIEGAVKSATKKKAPAVKKKAPPAETPPKQ